MSRRLGQLLSSRALRTAPLATTGRALRLGADVMTRRPERVIDVTVGDTSFSFLTYPGSARTGSRGISVLGEHYEPLLARAAQYIQPGDVVIDGGANTGIFTCAFGTLGATVHAFEPLEATRAQLSRNVELNRLEHRTRIVPVAIGAEDGMAEMNISRGPISASIVSQSPGEHVDVEVQSLDSYLETANAGRVTFMKLDIEGAETAGLSGAAKLLVRDRPALCLEVWREEDLSEITGMLDPLNYRLCELTFDGEAPLPAPFRPIANLLALPEDNAH
ncbi:MAG: FkbM family methyltransferase [Pseudomonadota bacterium]